MIFLILYGLQYTVSECVWPISCITVAAETFSSFIYSLWLPGAQKLAACHIIVPAAFPWNKQEVKDWRWFLCVCDVWAPSHICVVTAEKMCFLVLTSFRQWVTFKGECLCSAHHWRHIRETDVSRCWHLVERLKHVQYQCLNIWLVYLYELDLGVQQTFLFCIYAIYI